MLLEQASNDEEPEAESRGLPLDVSTRSVETLKDPAQLAPGNPDSLVRNLDADTTVLRSCHAHPDLDRVIRVFHGVLQQISEDESQIRTLPAHGGHIGPFELHGLGRECVPLAEFDDVFVEQRTQLDDWPRTGRVRALFGASGLQNVGHRAFETIEILAHTADELLAPKFDYRVSDLGAAWQDTWIAKLALDEARALILKKGKGEKRTK